MNKHRVEHRAEKLYEKLLSQSGGRWMNRVAREQRIQAKLDNEKSNETTAILESDDVVEKR